MNKKLDTALFYIALIVIAFLLLGISKVFGANVTDNGGGNKGYILVNDGTGQGHKGEWTDIRDIPKLKGDKGDTGATGQQGIQGDKGDIGVNGKDVDPATVTNLQNTDTILQDNINIEQFDRVKLGNDLSTNINSETTQRKNADNTLQNNINSVNSRVDDVSNRVSKLERTQFVLETSFRILDTKKITLRPFFRQNFTRNKIDIIGLKIDVKLGQSYEEKLIGKINTRLDKIEKTIGNAPIITQVIDSKGNVKSISINANRLKVSGEF